jgi:DNA-binding CsgD family transcriptional regulator
MVGRAAEREAMSAARARAQAGEPQVVLVTGPAGIGKTRLVSNVCSDISDACVLTGESAPLAGASLAYGPFVAALGDRVEWLIAGNGPDGGAGDMLTRRHRLFVRVLGVLESLAPLLLVLEDLHWADDSSHELLDFLTVRLRAGRVMVIATIRDSELDSRARSWLAELERRPAVLRMRLGPMADAEIGVVIADLLPPGASADTRAAVLAAAAGNPLYAREMASTGSAVIPASLADAVLAKATGVTVQARAVLDQVSVADGGMSHDLLAATVQLSERRLIAATRAAVATGLLGPAGDGYAFGHTLIRLIIYQKILPGERRRLHRRLATAVAAQPGSDPGLLAQHWHLADDQERAGPAALRAARHAVSVRAYPEATKNYALAIELAQWVPGAGPGLLEEAARTASWAGDPQQAVTWAADAVAQSADAVVADRARRLERLGRYLSDNGDQRAALEATEEAMSLLAAEEPSQLKARVLAALATRRMFVGESRDVLPLAEQAVRVAEQVGADAVRAHGLATLGMLQAQHGELDAGLSALRVSHELAFRAGSIEDVVRTAANRMYLLHYAGRFDEALQAAREGSQAARIMGAPPSLTAVLDGNTAGVLVATGRWSEADRLLTELVAHSPPYITRLWFLQLQLAAGRGDSARAAELAGLLRKSADDPRLTGPMHACLAEQALNAADLVTAATEVMDGLAVLRGSAVDEDELRVLAVGARLRADLAVLPEPARPRAMPGGWDSVADEIGTRAGADSAQPAETRPELVAYGLLIAAEQARELGGDSRATWRGVAEAWQTAGQPYREAYARMREAEAAARAGRREQAMRALAMCEALATRLEAAPLLALAAGLSRRARLAGGAVAPASAPAAAARYDLTDRETDVLARLATGDSNRQIARALFISERTVAVHVSRILDKLGVRNRTEAATVGIQMGLPGQR